MNRAAPTPSLSSNELSEAVDWAIATRRSVRAFLDMPVPRDVIHALLDVARNSASGMNAQPWRVRVVAGRAKDKISEEIAKVDDDPAQSGQQHEPYDYYPTEWVPPFIERRRKVGWDLYGLLGISKGDKARMHVQHGRNYRFFDAPVGLFFTLNRVMSTGSYLDYGMFLQSFMVAARARGLDTCPQVAFTKYHRIIAQQLSIPDDEILVCGMSLGYADTARVENALITEREPVDRFTTYHDDIPETLK